MLVITVVQLPVNRRQECDGPPVRFVICMLVSAVFVLPLFAMVAVAFTPRELVFDGGTSLWPLRFATENFSNLFASFPVWRWFSNAMIVATLTTALSVEVNLPAGFALAKPQFAGRTGGLLIVLSTLMVPAQAVVIPQFELVARTGLIGLFWAVILPSASTALVVFVTLQRFYLDGFSRSGIRCVSPETLTRRRVQVESASTGSQTLTSD